MTANLDRVRGPSYNPLDSFTNIHSLLVAVKKLQSLVQVLTHKVDKLSFSAISSSKGPGNGPKNLNPKVGRHTFHNMGDFGAYMESILPKDLPYRPFIDIYSFLERVKSYKDFIPWV